MVLEGERAGKLGKGKVLLDATSGNTGIAYAMLGAARGQTMAAAKRQASTVATAVARASTKPARTRVSTTTPKRKKRNAR